MSIQFTCSCSEAFSTFPLLQNFMKLSSNSSYSHKTVLYSYIEKWMHPLYFKKNFWSRKKGIIHENISSWYGRKSIKDAGVSTTRIPLSTQGFAHLGLALLHPSGDNKKLVWLGPCSLLSTKGFPHPGLPHPAETNLWIGPICNPLQVIPSVLTGRMLFFI